MFILIDYRIPEAAKENLAAYGQLIELKSNAITYNAISSHPDIFCCQTPDCLILAPNSPSELIEKFTLEKISFLFGKQAIGMQYPQTSLYNAVVTQKLLIHSIQNTDKTIIENNCEKRILSVHQGYTRCNLVALGENNFITSDQGIYKQLHRYEDVTVLYVSPEHILLSGVKNGFFGGCCGIYQNQLFVIGNLDYLAEGTAVKALIAKLGFQIIELYDGPLFDGGSIFFIAS